MTMRSISLFVTVAPPRTHLSTAMATSVLTVVTHLSTPLYLLVISLLIILYFLYDPMFFPYMTHKLSTSWISILLVTYPPLPSAHHFICKEMVAQWVISHCPVLGNDVYLEELSSSSCRMVALYVNIFSFTSSFLKSPFLIRNGWHLILQ